MNRRLVIKQVLIMAGGIALLPACVREEGQSTVSWKNIKLTLDQENFLAEVTETLIPETDTPGAKKLNLHLFVLKMLDDCYSSVDQQLFLKGMSQLQDKSYDQFTKSYTKLSKRQQQEVLLQIQHDKSKSPELDTFYNITKQQTINGYMNSKYVMTNLVKWELVPGRYNGYFPVKSA